MDRQSRFAVQAERLSIFMEREWTFTRCLTYLQSLSANERRELWDDIDHQRTVEARDKITGKVARLVSKPKPKLSRLQGCPEGIDPCSKCHSALGLALYDPDDPTYIVWLCRYCFEHLAPGEEDQLYRHKLESPS
jgi:hypothetical protein